MKIAELFYSVQGEGSLVGVPSVFVRTSGCNLRCSWCDTPYTSWQPEGTEFSLDQIVDEVRAYPARHVVLTGGEPMILPDVGALTERLRALGLHITVETAGTVFRPVACDLMSISPKLSNSTPDGPWAVQHDRLRIQHDVLRELMTRYSHQLKFVIEKPEDMNEVRSLLTALHADRERVILMPEGTDRGRLQERSVWLAEICKDEGFRLVPGCTWISTGISEASDMDTKTALSADVICREHLAGRSHPERPERFDVVMEALARSGALDSMLRMESRAGTEQELLLCHTPEYLGVAKRDVDSGRHYLSTGDTDIDANSWDVALHAAGGVLNGVDAVLDGRVQNAFCVVRPPGHHATASRGMGFCLFNNVALAARYAQRHHGLERVLIVDWDVHHGNGTQEIFYQDPSVFFFSTHQWPLYPGTGRADETGDGAGQGTTMNFPFPAGSGRKQILGAVENSLMKAAADFRPELVLISAGFDSRIGDLLGNFTLTDEDFADLTRRVMEMGDGRVVSMLEGGYNLDGLASASAAHVAALMAD